ncbi:hypothetical protein HAZT_HAZT010070 [Hyalella azteca]|uniref:Caveolin n=1 Tax=Hyalella azteca TaxID=294128 RepID=A0A6A0H3G9_HYAAZ|nr:hypothetical protein HAZT_HAZT010070 [Hyalella azteca]
MGSDAEYNNMDRDPNNLNHHLQVMWDDVVGEPEGLHSMDSCWNCSRKTYDVSRTCCYGLLVILFGPLIALINGCNFACLSFGQIWCAGPCLRCCKINCGTFRKFTETCLLAVCAPYVEVCALIFSKIKVRHQKLPEADTDNAADYFNVYYLHWQVWCVGPCYRLFKINMATVRRFWETCLMATWSPLIMVMGLIFSNIKIRNQRLNDGEDKEPEDHFAV